MKIKLFLIFCLSFSSLHSVFCQSGRKDVIYLKNGSVIKGIIIEQVPGKTYKIQTADNNVFTYTVEEVEKITSESDASSTPVQAPASANTIPLDPPKKEKDLGFKKNGASGIVKIGPMGLRSFSGSAIVGYNVEGILFMGLGASVDAYKNIGNVDQPNAISGVDVLLPVYVDLRMFTSQKRFAFMYFIEMGYAPLLNSAIRYQSSAQSMKEYDKTSKGGAYYATGVGMRAFATDRIAVLIEFGFKVQNYSVDEHEPSNQYYYDPNTQTSTYTPIDRLTISPKTTITPYINFGVKF